LAVAVQGATIVNEYQGLRANVLVYKQRCDGCEYLAPTTSFAVALVPNDTYDTPGFACPRCANYQVVRIGLELGEEAALFLASGE
jgi:hypothetical protein